MNTMSLLRRRAMAVVVAVALLLPLASASPSGAASWSSAKRVATGELAAVTADDTGKLHLVVVRQGWSGLDYVTNRSGSWKGARKPGAYYVTNKSGSWVRRRVTTSRLDYLDRLLIDPKGRPVIGLNRWSGSAHFRVARLASGKWSIATTPGVGTGSFTLDSKGRAQVVIWNDWDDFGSLRYDEPTSSGWKSPKSLDAKGHNARIRTTGGIRVIYQRGSGVYVRTR